nr:hypothetical protein [Tanacetum cinerariifolium]
AYWALKHVNFDLKIAGDHRKLQLNELNELRNQAYENYMIYKEMEKKLHDSKIKNRIFNVGDHVLLFNSRLKIFLEKLKTRWFGPFTITQVFSYGTVEFSQPNGPNFKVNGHRVKHYFGGDILSKELADRSITRPKGFAEDVFVKVGKFHFPSDFVVVDFEADTRVPLILWRSFLRTCHALINVYGEEITLREPIVKSSSTILTQFGESDFFLEEIEDFLKDDSIPSGIENSGIDPRFCTHKILMEDDYKPAVQSQRKANPKIHDVIKKEVIKLLDADMTYPTSDRPWVSPIHCVPKKGGMTVVANENKELIPTRLVTGWRVCIDYRKLNDATKKNHFPLIFMDQMLERLAGNEFYCFLDGFSREGIVLGHKISKSGIEVNRAKVDVITKLPHLTTVKGVRSFLRHAGFYRRFIQDFSKISRPMTHLIEKETPFVFSKECIDAFNTLKKKLIEAPILFVYDWNMPFELMCDASDYAIALKYLLNKQDEKPRLLRWVLLLQEFDITILDKKGSKNLAADHLSRLENPHQDVLENKDINENFPLETLGSLTSHSTPWFANIANFHARSFIKKGLTSQQKKKGIDFMGPFPSSKGNKCILVAVDYLSKWVEAKALPTNDARVVVKFLKSLFSGFGIPQDIISDHGTHFCNDQFTRVMIKYGVTHRLATSYHPQAGGQVEVNGHRVKHYFGGDIPPNVVPDLHTIFPSMIDVSRVRFDCPGPQELHILCWKLVWRNPYP